MVKKSKRKINSKCERQLITWGHYSFKKNFLHKVREYKDVKVMIVTEEYTSLTCSCCGIE